MTQNGVANQKRAASPPLRVAFGSQFGRSRTYDSTFMQAPLQSIIARAPGPGAGLSLTTRRLLRQAAEGDDAVAAVQLSLLMHYQLKDKANQTTPTTNTAEMDTLRASIRVCTCSYELNESFGCSQARWRFNKYVDRQQRVLSAYRIVTSTSRLNTKCACV